MDELARSANEDDPVGRVAAVLALLLFWLPLLGLVIAALAFWRNRQSACWTRRASQVAFVLAALAHLALGGMILFRVLQS